MKIRIVGKAFGTVKQPRDRYSQSGDGSLTITSAYRTLWLGWLGTAPGLGSQHPTYPQAVLDSRDAQQITPGYLCDVTLTYKAPRQEDAPQGESLPPDEYTESANEIEVPIEAHPNFSSFATEANGAIFGTPIPPMAQGPFIGWTASSPFSGYLTYKVGSVTESITSYHWAKPASVSSVVGQRSGNWLTISGSISRRGVYWTKTINRIYNAAGWNSTIYPN